MQPLNFLVSPGKLYQISMIAAILGDLSNYQRLNRKFKKLYTVVRVPLIFGLFYAAFIGLDRFEHYGGKSIHKFTNSMMTEHVLPAFGIKK